ncbi:MAG: polyphosphate kinase 1 [Myxococcota bacterium]
MEETHPLRTEAQSEPLDTLLPPSQRYYNRELSWIAFNRRVLEEAQDQSLPLLERLRFLCIFATNLDEFFMIRVSGLKQQVEAGVDASSADELTAREQLAAISAALRPLIQQQIQSLTEDLLPKLADRGIKVLPFHQLPKGQQRQIKDYFEKQVFPVLTPLVVDPGHPFPHISNLSLNLGVEVADPEDPSEHRFARIKVPEHLARLVPLPNRKATFVLLEEVIAAHIGRLFPGMTILSCHPFRITRNADIEIEEDEADDLLKSLEEELRRRRFGRAVRLQVDKQMPSHMCEMLLKVLRLHQQDCYHLDGPVGIADFMHLCKLDRPDLKFEPFQPQPHPRLKDNHDVFKVIRDGDLLLHHPFEAFDPVVSFLRQAAIDPDVLTIKQTLYRTSGDSPIVQALIRAAQHGKQVAVLLELKARFDEENNIQWARKLEEVGVHVVYGVLGLKTHAKMALVVRREKEGLRRYVHLGTGNYNASTAKVYTDLGFFSASPELGADASELFNFLTGYCKMGRFKKLVAAPVGLRDRLLQLIEREVELNRPERPGRIVIKCNQLTDLELVDALYEASQAGVRIDLIIRGTCCLRAGIPGLSENIRVISIVGRFLEHSRIFYFNNAGNEEIYVGSADWMNRNLDRRVETLFPIEDPQLRLRIRDQILGIYLRDNLRARKLEPDGNYRRLSPEPGALPIDSQEVLMQLALEEQLPFRLEGL